jgi:hypothetical protein
VAQSTTTRPYRIPSEEPPIGIRVNPPLRNEIDAICRQLNLTRPAVFRDGLIAFCQLHPEISPETTQRVIDAVGAMSTFTKPGRICPDPAPQVNNGEG